MVNNCCFGLIVASFVIESQQTTDFQICGVRFHFEFTFSIQFNPDTSKILDLSSLIYAAACISEMSTTEKYMQN